MSHDYPVHYSVTPPSRFTPIQLLVRVTAFVAVGAVGLSFGTLFALVYLLLPLIAASRLLSLGDSTAYVREDGPRIAAALRWIAAVSAWAGLVVDELPLGGSPDSVRLSIEGAPRPTPTTAMLRVLMGLPSALVLAFLCAVGVFVWLWAAASVLVTQQIGPRAFEYLVGLQRWSLRLLAYQASLVDAYPPFSFDDTDVGTDVGAPPQVAS